jgi:hypothetical protein
VIRNPGLAAIATSLVLVGAGLAVACSSGNLPPGPGEQSTNGPDGGADATSDSGQTGSSGASGSSGAGASSGSSGAGGASSGSSGAGASSGGGGTDGSASGDGAGGTTSSSGSGGSADGGDAGDSGGSYQPPPNAPNCGTTGSWGSGTLLSVSTGTDDLLDAITPDELTIVWTQVQGTTRTVTYADRPTIGGAFDVRSLPAGLYSNDRVAISPNGLRLVVVDADAQGFSELTRSSRSDDFVPTSDGGAASTTAYQNLNGTLGPGEAYGDPVIAADDAVFFYSVYAVQNDAGAPDAKANAPTIYRSARLLSTDVWPGGSPLASSTGLFPEGSLRQRPTGLSADQQTLFVWSEITTTERMAWLNGADTFATFADLGSRSMAAPNLACTSLYYSAQGSTSIDLFVATSN